MSSRSSRAASSAWSAGGSASARRLLLADVGHELLEEERVAAGGVGDPSLARPAPGDRPRSPSSSAALAAARERAELEHALGARDAARPARAAPRTGRGAPPRRAARARREAARATSSSRSSSAGSASGRRRSTTIERPRAGERADQLQERPAGVLAGLALLESRRRRDLPRATDGASPSAAASSSIERSPVACRTISRSGQ